MGGGQHAQQIWGERERERRKEKNKKQKKVERKKEKRGKKREKRTKGIKTPINSPILLAASGANTSSAVRFLPIVKLRSRRRGRFGFVIS